MSNVKTETIVRTVVLIVALINQGLTMAGKTLLPINDEQVAELVTLLITYAAALWAWWKNNSFTHAAIEADKLLDDMRHFE